MVFRHGSDAGRMCSPPTSCSRVSPCPLVTTSRSNRRPMVVLASPPRNNSASGLAVRGSSSRVSCRTSLCAVRWWSLLRRRLGYEFRLFCRKAVTVDHVGTRHWSFGNRLARGLCDFSRFLDSRCSLGRSSSRAIQGREFFFRVDELVPRPLTLLPPRSHRHRRAGGGLHESDLGISRRIRSIDRHRVQHREALRALPLAT